MLKSTYATILHNTKDCADPRNDPKGRRMEEFSPMGGGGGGQTGGVAGGCLDWKIQRRVCPVIQLGTYLQQYLCMNCMQFYRLCTIPT